MATGVAVDVVRPARQRRGLVRWRPATLVLPLIVCGCGLAFRGASTDAGERERSGGEVAGAVEERGLDPTIFDYDGSAPLDVRVEANHALGDVQVLDLSYESPGLGRVPAYLYQPVDPDEPGPALILMHGLPGTRGQLGRLARAYAEAGVTVLSITAPYSRFDLPYREPVLIPAPRFDAYDGQEMVQGIQDLRRAVDLLQETDGVDGSRIGYVGFSMGGGLGAILAAIEPRLRAIALMSPTSGLVTWVRTISEQHPVAATWLELPEAEREAWERSMWHVEPFRWLARAPDRPLLIQAATNDGSVTREDTETLLAAAPSTTRVRWYEAGHRLSPTAFRDQAAFLAETLGFELARFTPPTELF